MLASVLCFAGCSDAAPAATVEPSESVAAPVFASDEEALAAAVDTYEKYLDLSAEVSQEGGVNPERLLPLLDQSYGQKIVEEFQGMERVGLHVVGRGIASAYRLIEYSTSTEDISVYACQSVGSTRIIDVDGSDITPPDREQVIPMVLVFHADLDAGALLSGSTRWSGASFC
ncbi:hypothetical protein ACDF64_07680 [Agromyces sp. MMS24-JH15]|uniref:hypothetical protein n=1 Tax=Agromyces sp. MMS24-JH15 TaxID=3243765 RepID=UPI00374A16F7